MTGGMPDDKAFQFVNINDLNSEERNYVAAMRDSIGYKIPNLEEPRFSYIWALKQGEVIVGAFAVIPFNHMGVPWGEVRAGIWSPSRTMLEAVRYWLGWLMETNDYLIARVLPRNRTVKKAVQALGFALIGYDQDQDGRPVEVYKLERGKLMASKPRKRQPSVLN